MYNNYCSKNNPSGTFNLQKLIRFSPTGYNAIAHNAAHEGYAMKSWGAEQWKKWCEDDCKEKNKEDKSDISYTGNFGSGFHW